MLRADTTNRRPHQSGAQAAAPGESAHRCHDGEAATVLSDASPAPSEGDTRPETPRLGANADTGTLAASFLAAMRERSGVPPGEPVLWCYHGRWHLWTGRMWREIAPDDLRRRFLQFAHSTPQPMPELDKALIERVLLHLEGQTLLECEDVAPPFYVRPLDCPSVEARRTILLANGVLDLDDLSAERPAKLEPLDSRHFALTALPVSYDPAATCPQWQRFLESALPRSGPEDRRQEVLQECFFYTLLNDCRFEKMLLMLGEGGSNGKSTIQAVLEALLGPDNVAHVPFNDLAEPFRIHELVDKLANCSSEVAALDRIKVALLKQLISGERISADRKHRPAIDFRSRAKLVIACNRMPRLPADDEGIWRRLIVMPFEVTFPEERADVNLPKRLIDTELAGILNWTLAAGPRLLERGAFSPCGRCARAAAVQRAEDDTVAAFVADCCELDACSLVPRETLYAIYQHYVHTRLGRAARPVGRAEFGKRLRGRFRVDGARLTRPLADGQRPHLYTGIALASEGRAMIEELPRPVHRRVHRLAAALSETSGGVQEEDGPLGHRNFVGE